MARVCLKVCPKASEVAHPELAHHKIVHPGGVHSEFAHLKFGHPETVLEDKNLTIGCVSVCGIQEHDHHN